MASVYCLVISWVLLVGIIKNLRILDLEEFLKEYGGINYLDWSCDLFVVIWGICGRV